MLRFTFLRSALGGTLVVIYQHGPIVTPLVIFKYLGKYLCDCDICKYLKYLYWQIFEILVPLCTWGPNKVWVGCMKD